MRNKIAKPRAPNLSEELMKSIISLLDGWEGPLSWAALIDEINVREGVLYTRQTLSRYEQITLAFNLVKKRRGVANTTSERKKSLAPIEQEMLLDRVTRLEAENSRLKDENQRLLERFVIWTYNVKSRGFDEEFLNRPLPIVDRGRSKVEKLKK